MVKLRGQEPVSRSLLNLCLNLRDFEVIILVSNTTCFESKSLFIYQNATNKLGIK